MRKKVLSTITFLLLLISCKNVYYKEQTYYFGCKGEETVKKLAKKNSVETIFYLVDFCNIKEYVWYYDETSIVYYKITSEDKIKTKKTHIAEHWNSTVGFEYGSFFKYGIDNFECFSKDIQDFSIFQKDEKNKFKRKLFIFDLECLKNTRYDENSFGRFIQYDLSVILEDDFYSKLYSNAITE